MIIDEQDYICHFGVLGMKWGVRKQKPQAANVKKASKKGTSKKLKGTGPKVNKVSKKTRRRGRNMVQQAWHDMWRRDPVMEKINAEARAKMLDYAIAGALTYGAALGTTKTARLASVAGLGAYEGGKLITGRVINKKKNNNNNNGKRS